MLIKSGTITQGSGSLGGMTMSHNRGGLYLRARTIPTDPNSIRQQGSRAAFTNAVQAWTGLAPELRAGWNTWAANTPFVNALGDPLVLTGQQAYVYATQPRTQVNNSGLAPIPVGNDAPTLFNTGEVVSMVDTPGIDDPQFKFNATLSAPASADGVVLLYVGRPQNASKNFFKGPYQLAADTPFTNGETLVAFEASLEDGDSWVSSTIPAIGDYLPIKLVCAYADMRLSQQFRTFIQVADLSA